MNKSNIALRLNRRALLVSTAAAASLASLPRAVAQDAPARPSGPAPFGLPISAEFPFSKKELSVEGSTIAYVDEGEGQPVVFLHGNPTSSYLWRNIIPYVSVGYRAIAPDLIGMGDSGKPDIGYTFGDHSRFIDAFINALGLKDIVLVVHDWGSAIGMRYARMNEGDVAGLVFMEAIVPPALPAPGYDAMPPELADFFRTLRSPKGEEMVLGQNYFVEQVLPNMGVLRVMGEAEMAAYRAPYSTPESRRPTLQWPREIPIGGEPAEATKEVTLNGEWIAATTLPKLMFYAEPGILGTPEVAAHLAATLKNIETRFVGAGTHYLQEDHPHVIGRGIWDWLRRL